MIVKIWGVRGSVPSGNPETSGVGGNTTCVEVRCGDEIFILDTGTGIRNLGAELAKKMLASGLASLDLSFTGTQEVINTLTLGYSLDQQMAAFKMFKDAGYTNQTVKLYIPLNAPGETADTLQRTIERIQELYQMFGREHVLPFIFFIGIQPGTPVEKLLIEQGYLRKGYNPLTLNPFAIKRLLYNPKPLGPIIGRSYLRAVEHLGENNEYVGRTTIDLIEVELHHKKPAKRPLNLIGRLKNA